MARPPSHVAQNARLSARERAGRTDAPPTQCVLASPESASTANRRPSVLGRYRLPDATAASSRSRVRSVPRLLWVGLSLTPLTKAATGRSHRGRRSRQDSVTRHPLGTAANV